MGENILKLFIEKGFLLDREMLDFFNELENETIAKEIIDKIALVAKKKVITKHLVSENFDKLKPVLFDLDNDKKKLVEKFFVNVSISVEVKKEIVIEDKKDIKRAPIKIISSPILTSQKLTVKDFVRHFRSRYNFIKGLLQQRQELENLTSIDKIKGGNRVVSIIGIVSSKTVTKNKNIILEVEDLTDRVKLLINQNREEVFQKAKEILLDDVVGFKCSGNKDFLFVNDLFYPDAHIRARCRSEEETYALFISDIHVGSSMFLQNNFEKFIDWLNCKDCYDEQKELIKKIKYIFIVGDNIDGVGIYPGQEKFLIIKDMKLQYEKLAEYLNKIPKHINIIMCPGQHDGVRVAEPQPPIGIDFGEPLHKISNLYLVSNPSIIEIEGKVEKQGIRVLMYHGASMHPIINEIEELRLINAHRNPTKAVKHLLLRRHLAPIHGSMVYIPNADEDPMLIKEVPDIVATGDLHRTDIDKYNGILLIAGSCWQSITPFEEKVGNLPDPCKVPMLNLKTGALKILDFTDEPIEKECIEVKNGENFDLNKKEIVCEVKK
ncbi:metallophosphoesterase [Candidatus Pacearchaeota archaeon]|nr:metallophosphoesterase [Candidatus Pacearchaeota archaeon]